MKVCYIAHPISGNIEENLADIRRIVRRINLEQPDIVPFVPYYVDIVSLNDDVPAERERGIKNDVHIMTSGLVDEVWLTGTKISYGMKCEEAVANGLKIPVINLINKL